MLHKFTRLVWLFVNFFSVCFVVWFVVYFFSRRGFYHHFFDGGKKISRAWDKIVGILGEETSGSPLQGGLAVNNVVLPRHPPPPPPRQGGIAEQNLPCHDGVGGTPKSPFGIGISGKLHEENADFGDVVAGSVQKKLKK